MRIAEALGYPDINDHDQLRRDPSLAAVMGKLTAKDKRCEALAGKSTLNRLEHSPEEGEARASSRYYKACPGAGGDQPRRRRHRSAVPRRVPRGACGAA